MPLNHPARSPTPAHCTHSPACTNHPTPTHLHSQSGLAQRRHLQHSSVTNDVREDVVLQELGTSRHLGCHCLQRGDGQQLGGDVLRGGRGRGGRYLCISQHMHMRQVRRRRQRGTKNIRGRLNSSKDSSKRPSSLPSMCRRRCRTQGPSWLHQFPRPAPPRWHT